MKEWDLEILKYLKRVEYVNHDDGNGNDYSLRFYFKPNEFFENDVLNVKFYAVIQDDVEKKDGTLIKWKEGKNCTKKNIQKTVKNKKSGKTKTISKIVQNPSFFNLFEDILPANDDDDDEKVFNLMNL